MTAFRIATAVATSLVLSLAGTGLALGDDETPEEQRAEIRAHAEEVLAELYEAKPGTREEVANAVGYAVFDSWGLKIFVTSTERGKGLAYDNASGKTTYMKMFSGGVGLGIGITKFKVIMVFHTREKFDKFVAEGWDFSGEVEASAKTSESGASAGGAGSFSNVSVYQFTKKGLALEAFINNNFGGGPLSDLGPLSSAYSTLHPK